MNLGYVILLCNLTMTMAEPWVNAGYHVIMVDPQHPKGIYTEGNITKIGATVLEAMPYLGKVIRGGQVVFVASFPPCTDVALCGTKHWAAKAKVDRYFQAKAAIVAEQCRTLGELSGAPYFFENPKSAFSMIFGKPQHKFHPYYFTGYCPSDHYTKDTWLWTGNGFVMPEAYQATFQSEPDDRIHKCPPSADRQNIRSATPKGFAYAVFISNAPHLKSMEAAA